MDWFAFFIFGLIAGVALGIAISPRRSKSESAIRPEVVEPTEIIETVDVAAGEILDSLPDAVLLVDDAHLVRFANAGVRAMYSGVSLPSSENQRDGVPMKTLLEVTGEHRFSLLVRDVFESGQSKSMVIEGPARQNADTFWKVDAAVFAANQRRRTVRVLIHDITNEVRLDRVRRDFVSNASHELRTPLTMIGGSFDALGDADLPPTIRQKMVESGQRNTKRMARLIDDMLTLSKAENPDESLNLAPMKVGPLVEKVLAQLQPLVDEVDGVVVNEIPEDLQEVRGDEFYWEQIFYNLVENALKYRREGVAPVVKIGAQVAGGVMEMWVQDNGRGIPGRHLPHVFRRFFRGEISHNQQEAKGTGLGLSIVKRAVEAQGGTVSVESDVGEGTRFTMTLPLNINDQSS